MIRTQIRLTEEQSVRLREAAPPARRQAPPAGT